MAQYPATPTKIFIRQGAAYYRGTDLEPYLSAEEYQTLFAKWKADWPIPNEFAGNVRGITCEQILEVGEAAILKTYGKTLGPKLLEMARRHGETL